MRASRSRSIELRGLACHLREWGEAGAPRLFMLHGWMDVSATFQFVVDELARDWHVIAPDWRGFGRSAWAGDAYWFPDYLGDLDALLRLLSPDEPARLVGHSMGGNVACLYAGIRPERVAAVVALDAFGLADRSPDEAPARYAEWLDDLARPVSFRPYADFAALAARLTRDNPRLGAECADWLAHQLAEPDGAGGVRLLGDPAHRRTNATLYRRAEAEACWCRVSAPVLWLVPDGAELRRRLGVDDQAHEAAKACFPDFREVVLPDCGHNLHHDRPADVARIIEDFLLSHL
ncbi:alpha/beta fold hydrolase [Pseudothauera rhizosphaerae]|uniref:Alpha/beta hydrolase n=1 Tax=Pseudothauera rhizosphaerae TaxID=2565932 RepID=A0A4S4AXU4_9RHOO|nr:alpha/beta hydrolase [Pseudothauera rhizosphaerae]THF63422.1 alpha/beta hydrolase [Pseudothauera rhizosphaerae]